MKKIAFFTSALALAACSGGGGEKPGAIITPSNDLTPEQRAAAIASNSQLTDMDSFVIVGGKNSKTNPNSRIATTLEDGSVRYDLSDVEFKTASMLMNTGVDDSAILKFKTTNGKIDEITMDLSGVDRDGTNIDLKIDTRRTGDSNVFSNNSILSYKENGVEQNTEDGEDLSNFGLLYESGAKNHDMGLRYADFGVVQWGDVGAYDTSNYFAGGYNVKRTDLATNGNPDYTNMNNLAQNAVGEKLVFSGHADGVVRIGDMSDDLDTYYNENNKLDLSTTATLEFANGTSTLTANFANWYDVTATMGNDGKLSNLVFSNGDKEGFYHGDDFKWKRPDEHDSMVPLNEHVADATAEIQITDPNFVCPDGPGQCSTTFVRDGFVEYYGDNGNPAEAVGVIRYGDSVNPAGAMRFDMGFGAKRN